MEIPFVVKPHDSNKIKFNNEIWIYNIRASNKIFSVFFYFNEILAQKLAAITGIQIYRYDFPKNLY